MSDDIDAALEARASGSQVQSDDIDNALTMRSSGRMLTANPPVNSPGSTSNRSPIDDVKALTGAALRYASGIGSAIVGGYQGLRALAQGEGLDEAANTVNRYRQEHTYQPPKGSDAEKISGALESNYNPMNWPSWVFHKAGEGTLALTNSPAAATAVETGLNAALMTAPLIKGLKGAPAASGEEGTSAAAETPTATPEPAMATEEAARPAYFEPQDIPGTKTPIDTEPVEGGLPDAATDSRADILRRVGIENARESALKGDAKGAATDFQLSRFDEPAGVEAKSQFQAERQALENHAAGIIQKTGGTLGMDEDSLQTRGQTIAQPFDDLRNWFDAKKQELYSEADKRAAGAPISSLENTSKLLKDPDFTETLLAKDQGGLLGSIQRQFQRFQDVAKEQGGFTVENAENFRKWLNQIWSPENRQAIGQIKEALDNDVMKGAGEDIYGAARALAKAEKATLDNPKGVSRLLDADPTTSLNRVTPYTKIPDTITRLDPDQFQNVLKTLQDMPPEIQPQAQAAISEIKAHLANKIYEAGSSTQNQWNAPKVSKIIQANRLKLNAAFNPQELQSIQDLESAGKILRVDQSYPGAAAQAANALKRGMMSRALNRVGSAAGAGVGGVIAGPFGAAGGAAAGEALGSSVGQSIAEKAAVKRWQSGIRHLGETTP